MLHFPCREWRESAGRENNLTTERKRNLHRICRSKQKLMTPLSSKTAQDRKDRTDSLDRFQNTIVCIGGWFVLLTKPLKCTRDCKSVTPSVLISRTHSPRNAADRQLNIPWCKAASFTNEESKFTCLNMHLICIHMPIYGKDYNFSKSIWKEEVLTA